MLILGEELFGISIYIDIKVHKEVFDAVRKSVSTTCDIQNHRVPNRLVAHQRFRKADLRGRVIFEMCRNNAHQV